MTIALCFKCGHAKFGAWCPCKECGYEPCGDRKLDIIFSDHFISHDSIKRFGEVVRQLHAKCNDDRVCFWAFMKYASDNYPMIVSVPVPQEYSEKVNKVLDGVELPVFEIGPGIQRQLDEELYEELRRERMDARPENEAGVPMHKTGTFDHIFDEWCRMTADKSYYGPDMENEGISEGIYGASAFEAENQLSMLLSIIPRLEQKPYKTVKSMEETIQWAYMLGYMGFKAVKRVKGEEIKPVLPWGYFYFIREHKSRIIDRKDMEACDKLENLLENPEIVRILDSIVRIAIIALKEIYPKINSRRSKGIEKIVQLISESAIKGFQIAFIEDKMKAKYYESKESEEQKDSPSPIPPPIP